MQAKIEIVSENFKLILINTPISAVKFQIKYYGFKETNKTQNDEYIGQKKEINIINVIQYLEENDIKVSVCTVTEDFIKNIHTHKNNFLTKIEKLKKIKEEIPKSDLINFSKSLNFLKRDLLEYQLKSCYHLFHSQSAANFSVPGSGKTSVVLAYYEKLKLEKKVKAILLIGPKNCFYSWNTEFIETLGRDPALLILDKEIKLSR